MRPPAAAPSGPARVECGVQRVEVVGHLDLALLGPRPAHGQLAQRRDLVERDRALPEQLQQREEPGDDDDRRVGVGGERAERHRAAVPQPVHEHGGLLAHADGRGVQVADVDAGRRRLRLLGLRRQRRQLLGTDLPDQLGQQRREVRLERDQAREAAALRREPLGQVGGDQLVGAVLQQPGEQQVAGLEQLEVLLRPRRPPTAAAGRP